MRISGWLHTAGTQILDATGRPVRLLGIGIHGMEAGSGLEAAPSPGAGCGGWRPPDAATYENVLEWGFNSARVAVSWANLEPTPPVTNADGTVTHQYDQAYLLALDGIVEAFGRRGIAVILDMHQFGWSPAFPTGSATGIQGCGSGMPAWLYPNAEPGDGGRARAAFFANRGDVQAGFVDAWAMVAARYATDPTVVAADLLNEPYSVPGLPASKLHLDALYARVGQAIRSADPNILLVFEDSQDDGSGSFVLTAPPPFPNEVYSFHLYQPRWIPDSLGVATDYTERATAWDVPLWIGEFNAFGYTRNAVPPRKNWEADLHELMDYCRRHDVGWSIWAYDGASSVIVRGTNQAKPKLIPALQDGF